MAPACIVSKQQDALEEKSANCQSIQNSMLGANNRIRHDPAANSRKARAMD